MLWPAIDESKLKPPLNIWVTASKQFVVMSAALLMKRKGTNASTLFKWPFRPLLLIKRYNKTPSTYHSYNLWWCDGRHTPVVGCKISWKENSLISRKVGPPCYVPGACSPFFRVNPANSVNQPDFFYPECLFWSINGSTSGEPGETGRGGGAKKIITSASFLFEVSCSQRRDHADGHVLTRPEVWAGPSFTKNWGWRLGRYHHFSWVFWALRQQ